MIPINVRTDVESFMRDFGQLRLRQMPHVRTQALNAVARDAVAGVKTSIRTKFRTSGPGLTYLLRHVRIVTPGSQLGRLTLPSGAGAVGRVYIGIIPPEAKGQLAGWLRYRGSLLAMLEEGGRTPGPRDFGGLLGLGRYAVPITQPTARPRYPLALWPINLGLQARRSIEGPLAAAGLQGKRRTYLVPARWGAGHAVLFQRYGRSGQRGSDDTTLPLFWTQNETRLPARRFFFSTVERVVATRLTWHLERAMQHGLFGRGAYGAVPRGGR